MRELPCATMQRRYVQSPWSRLAQIDFKRPAEGRLGHEFEYEGP
jgi:hypothetical protein